MVEAGRAGTSVESLVKVCRRLNVSATWLLFGTGPKSLSRHQSSARSRKSSLGNVVNMKSSKDTEMKDVKIEDLFPPLPKEATEQSDKLVPAFNKACKVLEDSRPGGYFLAIPPIW